MNDLEVRDRWDEQSSRHIRAHVQQGLSLAMQKDPTTGVTSGPVLEQDLNRYRIAQVRFRNTSDWEFCGHMFSVRFLFPAPERDESLEALCAPIVQDILDGVCHKYNLDKGALGKVTHYM